MNRFFAALASALICLVSPAAELVILTDENWDKYAPPGKEADAILGDYVLKNDKVWAVVAQPVKGRNANMTVKLVGGCLIDLTTITRPNDQLSALFTTMKRTFEKPEMSVVGGKAVLTLRAASDAKKPEMVLSYELEDGKSSVLIRTVLSNAHAEPLEVALDDFYRADDFPEKAPKETENGFWIYDNWFDQAYLIAADGHRLNVAAPAVAKAVGKVSYVRQAATDSKVALKPGEKYEFVRRIYPADHPLAAKGEMLKASGAAGVALTLNAAEDSSGNQIPGIAISLNQNGKLYGSGRTGADGSLSAFVPPGRYQVVYGGVGYGWDSRTTAIDVPAGERASFNLPLSKASSVVAQITSESGGPIPCKVRFKSVDGNRDPVFGPKTGSTAVMNLCYTADGKFTQKINPGQYDVTILYGPEYDAVQVPLDVAEGAAVPLKAVLKRAFSTPGWVSADFHSHSSPSGDNTCDQRGRVLNLLCEHIEFAPCTEHNRVDTYGPHLKALNAEKLMGTCIGIELTGSPLPLNHQNVFPMKMHPRTQDNGGPLTDADPQKQIKRLAEWDASSEKLIQQNHPDIGWLFFDKDGDKSPDSGYADGFRYMSVIEIHPIHTVLEMKATYKRMTITENTTIFNWLQLLNQGHRIPGVVNSDAHQAFHGSGGLRNFVRCSAAVPGEIDPMEIVRNSKKGNLVFSTAPFLSVKLGEANPGDDLKLPGGKGELAVSVQCANWYDIDRVQVLVNGRPDPKLNFTRKQNPETFGNSGAMRFERKIPILLESDAHIIVAVVGSEKLGDNVGPSWGAAMPAAVSNPIFVDVDGDGFKPNKDTLDAPLPVKQGAAAKAPAASND